MSSAADDPPRTRGSSTWLGSDLYRHRELLWILVQRNLKIRYKNSTLGFFWTLLGPIFMILIYWAFIKIVKIQINIESLVTGIIVWHFFATCAGDSLNTILGNASLVTKTAFPRIVLPLAMVCANLVNYLLTLAVLVIFLLIRNPDFGPLYWLPALLCTHFAFCLGISLMLSSLNVFFRDVEHLMNVLLLAWFFISPVMYTFEDFVFTSLPQAIHPFYFVNPMAGIVTAYRNIFLSVDTSVPAAYMVVPLALAWVTLLIGIVLFRRLEKRFGDEL